MDREKLKLGLLGAVFIFAGCTASEHSNYLEGLAGTLFQIKSDQRREALESVSKDNDVDPVRAEVKTSTVDYPEQVMSVNIFTW
ncbi:TPA: hypothetical protein QEM72_000635 [Pseudomonas putida]|uniref:hypothetical protein n=1 Tax=Pseudomonas putida TaxID=303 RepID=UPI0023640C42|nr:hypothetical protein [Pseudomonas putida]MDD2072691.1 hypothetical protein [Pseudomonas putida]HDS1690172.1 hypothetical protein [Pseudomonas putida]